MQNALKLVVANDDEPAELRRSTRRRVLLSAQVQNAFGEHQVKIRDISCSGARLEAFMIPPVGSRVLFTRGSIAVGATVVWCSDKTYGLAFHERIAETELLINIGRPGNIPPTAKKALFPIASDKALH